MTTDLFEKLEEIEEERDIPIGHRLGKVLLGAAAGVLATWLVDKAYDAYLDRSNDEEDEASEYNLD